MVPKYSEEWEIDVLRLCLGGVGLPVVANVKPVSLVFGVNIHTVSNQGPLWNLL